MPWRELSSDDCDRVGATIPYYGGTWPCDELPSPKLATWFIGTLQPHTMRGSHFVLIFNVLPDVCVYVDSYGFKPSYSTMRWLANTGKRLFYSKHECQSLESELCGAFCLLTASELLRAHGHGTMGPMAVTSLIQELYFPPTRGLGTAFNDRVVADAWVQRGWHKMVSPRLAAPKSPIKLQ